MDESTINALLATLSREGGFQSQRKEGDTRIATPYTLIPEGYQFKSLEALMDAPPRYARKPVFHGIDEMLAYAKRFGFDDTSVIFADFLNNKITCVIDYNGQDGDGPGWMAHTATYNCPLSPEWAIWLGHNGKVMDQGAFASFVEDNIQDIARPEGSGFPSGADMLELARNFTAKKKVHFESAQRESDGTFAITFAEETTGGVTTRADWRVPETFLVAVPVYLNDRADDGTTLVYPIVARLRYRVDGGKLALWYDLLRPDKVREQAFERQIARTISVLGREVGPEGEVMREGMPLYRAKSPVGAD